MNDLGFNGLFASFLKATQESLGGSQMHEDDWPRLAANASGFHNLPVGVTAGDFLLKSRHIFSVYILHYFCQANFVGTGF